MNILIVSQHFFPDNFRINEIAEELVKKGNNVTVITSLPDYATGFVPSQYKDKFVDTYKGVNVLRVNVHERQTGILNRALNYVSFMHESSKLVKTLDQKFDVVFSYQTSPVLMAHAAIKAKKLFNIPLVLYCLDLWPESLKVWNVNNKNPLFSLMHLYSKWAYKKADVLAVSSKPFIDYMTSFNKIDNKNIIYLPQHCFPIKLRQRKFNSKKIFAFGGNIGAAQDIETIIRAVKHIDYLDFEVRIFGDGSELENCKNLASLLGVNNKITFYGRVDKETLIENYKKVDAFLLTLKQTGSVGDTIPAKLQEYMSCAKPVFSAVGTGGTDVIKEAKCGLTANPSDYMGLAENMRKFIENDSEFKDYGKNGRNYFNKNFTLDIFIEKLISLLRS